MLAAGPDHSDLCSFLAPQSPESPPEPLSPISPPVPPSSVSHHLLYLLQHHHLLYLPHILHLLQHHHLLSLTISAPPPAPPSPTPSPLCTSHDQSHGLFSFSCSHFFCHTPSIPSEASLNGNSQGPHAPECYSGFPREVLKMTPTGSTRTSRKSEDGQAQVGSVLSHLLVLLSFFHLCISHTSC